MSKSQGGGEASPPPLLDETLMAAENTVVSVKNAVDGCYYELVDNFVVL